MKLYRRVLPIVLALCLAMSTAALAADGAPLDSTETAAAAAAEQRDFDKFMEIFELYRDNYYIEKSSEDMLLDTVKKLMESDPELYRQVIDALLASGDSYSRYLDPKAVYDMENQKVYGGVGITVLTGDEGIYVSEVSPDSPADQAGIEVDDIVVTVDGHPVRNLTLDSIAQLARGAVGTKVTYGMLRPSTGELLSFEMVRGELVTVTVTYELMEGYAVCRINDFTGLLTFLEFLDFLDAIEAASIDDVIFDLRGNPGGDLMVVLDMLNNIIPEEDKVLTTVIPRDEDRAITYSTTGRGRKLDKILILVDGDTASAAELFSVVLQEYDMATVIGTQTFGKAIGQTIFELEDGTMAVITTLQATSPAGVKYHGVGVTPDMLVSNTETPRELPPCETLNFDNFGQAVIGSDGLAPLALEQRLVLLGFLKRADTLFDGETADALAVYQSRAGLEATGLLDRDTLISLTDTINYLKTITVKNDDQMAAAVAIMEEGK